jgi:hypothetical protein
VGALVADRGAIAGDGLWEGATKGWREASSDGHGYITSHPHYTFNIDHISRVTYNTLKLIQYTMLFIS